MFFDNIYRFIQYSISTKNLLSVDNRKIFERYYSSAINNLDKITCKNYLAKTKEIFELIDKSKNLKILEIGTGCGTQALWFSMNNAKVTSIDVKPQRLNVALERKKLLEEQFCMQLDLELLNYDFFEFYNDNKSKKFDIIWMEQTYHHIEPRNKLIPTIKEILKKGGYIVFSESNALNPIIQTNLFLYRVGLYRKLYNWGILKSLLGGFKTVDSWINSKGKTQIYGVERITRKSTLEKLLENNNFKIIDSKYFGVLPNRTELRSLYFLEKLPSRLLPFVFQYYNLVAQKK